MRALIWVLLIAVISTATLVFVGGSWLWPAVFIGGLIVAGYIHGRDLNKTEEDQTE